MKLQKPGMRTIKTGIGVMLCILAGMLNIADNTFYAAISCVICMQATVKSSLVVGKNRLKGTFVGGVVGFLFVSIRPGDPILSCLGIIATIYICNILNINKSINIACIVFCAIELGTGSSNPLNYSIYRMLDTSIGILIGVAVNYIIYRPNYLDKIYNEIKTIEDKSIELLRYEVENGIHMDKSSLIKDISNLEALYKKFLEELEYSNSEIDDKKINNIIDICKKIYMHLQVLESMKKKCYINEENYNKCKDLYDELANDIEIKDDISPVYNYHISIIIQHINEIRNIYEEKSII